MKKIIPRTIIGRILLSIAMALVLLAPMLATVPAPTLAAPQQYYIRIQAIRTANDDGSEETIITPAQVKQWVDKTNAVLSAANAAITIQFDSGPNSLDWTFLKNSKINHVYYGDSEGMPAANAVAAKYPGKLVIFFRYSAGSGADAKFGNGFADINTGFIALPPFDGTVVTSNGEQIKQNIWQMAHDFGHFMGLNHTFPGTNDLATGTPTDAAAYIRDNGGTAMTLDGDGIADTGPEAGTSFFSNQGWKLCSEHTSYTITGKKKDGSAFSYSYHPQRNNIMSYFACEPMSFTPGQISKIRQNVLLSQRKLLVQAPCNADFYGLPTGQFQTCFDYWVNRGLWPVTLSQYTAGGNPAMAGSFQAGASRPVWSNMTQAEFQQHFNELSAAGWRPAQVSVLSVSRGAPRFTAIWTKAEGAFTSLTGLTAAQYQQKWDEMRAAGYAHDDVWVYQENGVSKFGSTWVKRRFTDQLARANLTAAQYSSLWDTYYPQGFRTIRFQPYVDNGARRYVAIMEKLPGTWAHYLDMDPATAQAKYKELSAQGLRISHINVLDNSFSIIFMKP